MKRLTLPEVIFYFSRSFPTLTITLSRLLEEKEMIFLLLLTDYLRRALRYIHSRCFLRRRFFLLCSLTAVGILWEWKVSPQDSSHQIWYQYLLNLRERERERERERKRQRKRKSVKKKNSSPATTCMLSNWIKHLNKYRYIQHGMVKCDLCSSGPLIVAKSPQAWSKMRRLSGIMMILSICSRSTTHSCIMI